MSKGTIPSDGTPRRPQKTTPLPIRPMEVSEYYATETEDRVAVPSSVAKLEFYDILKMGHLKSVDVVVLIVAGTGDGIAQPTTWINALRSSAGRLALQIYSPFKKIHRRLRPYRFPQPPGLPHIRWGSLEYVRVVMAMFERALLLFDNALHFFVVNGTSVMLVDGPGLLRAATETSFFRMSHLGIDGHLPINGEDFPRLAQVPRPLFGPHLVPYLGPYLDLHSPLSNPRRRRLPGAGGAAAGVLGPAERPTPHPTRPARDGARVAKQRVVVQTTQLLVPRGPAHGGMAR